MGDPLIFEAPEPTPLTIRVRKDGDVVEHTFEVKPLAREQYEAAMKAQAEIRDAQAAGDMDPAPMLARFCDDLVYSMNGPVTITSLWQEGLLPIRMLAEISAALVKEAVGDPPA
jgi:hypothetical protein